MPLMILVTGKPGSGKTTLIQFLKSEIEKQLQQPVRYLNDRDILLAMASRTGVPSLVTSTDDNNFVVNDESAYDVAIQRLTSEIKAAGDGQVLLIEFSRRNYCKAFIMMEEQLVSAKYLIVYLKVPFEICKTRNIERSRVSNYVVPTNEMEAYFRQDDMDDLELKYPSNFVRFDGTVGLQELGQQSIPIMGFIRKECQ